MEKKDRVKSTIARDGRLFFTTTRVGFGFVSDHGDGSFAYDITGRRFIDFTTFVSVYNFGVGANAAVRNAAKAQIDRLSHGAFTDYYAEPPIEFAETMLKLLPNGFGRFFLSNSGTEANEAAIKFSRLFTGRQYLLAFHGAFHGRTMGSLAMTASRAVQREHFGPFPNVIHAPFAYCYRCPLKLEYPDCGLACVEHIRRYSMKEAGPKEFAAVFAEPIQGEGGYVVPPKEYFKEIKQICDDNGMLLVSDEVQSGYMRTGKFLAMDNFGVTADMYTMSKSAGGGLPLGVTVARTRLGDIPAGSHATTMGGNLAAVAAGTALLKYIIRNKRSLESAARQKGAYIMKRLRDMKERYEIVGDVRGIGLMIGVELVKSKKTKEPAVKERELILGHAFRNGLLLLPAGESTIRIIPPLTISDAVLEKGMDIFEEAVRAVTKK